MDEEEEVKVLNGKVSRAVLRLGVALLWLWGAGRVVVLIFGSFNLAGGRNYTKGARGLTFWTFLSSISDLFQNKSGPKRAKICTRAVNGVVKLG